MIPVIDVGSLLLAPGTSREVHLSGRLDELGTEVARPAAESEISVDLLLESVVEGILASGTISCGLSYICARCLKTFDEPLAVDVSEMFVTEPDPDGDLYALEPEGVLDPEQMVRDAVGLELPFSPLCRPDCLGLCARCGGDRNLGECSCAPEPDHRWAPLEGLLEQLNN